MLSEERRPEVDRTDDELEFDPVQVLSNWVNAQKNRIRELQNRITKLEANNASQDAQIKESEQEIERLIGENSIQKETINALTADKVTLNEEKDNLNTRIHESESEMERLIGENSIHRETVNALSAEKVTLNEEKDGLNQRIHESDSEIERFVGENSILRETINSLMKERTVLLQKLTGLVSRLGPVIEDLKRDHEQAQNVAKRLREEKLRPAEDAFSRRNAQKSNIQRLISEQTRVVERIRIQMQEYETDPEFWKDEIDTLSKQEEGVERLIKAFEENRAKAVAVAQRMGDQVGEIKNRIGRWEELTATFQDRIEYLKKLSESGPEDRSDDYPDVYAVGSTSLH